MSVNSLKKMLREARTELMNLVAHSEKIDTMSVKTLSAVAFAQKQISEKIATFLQSSLGPLKWRSPESGTWHAKHQGYEISVYKEAGRYYWQVNCSDDSAPGTLEEAEEIVSRMVGLE